MALSQSVVSDQLEAFRAGEGVDLVRSVRLVMQQLTSPSEMPGLHIPRWPGGCSQPTSFKSAIRRS
jgi:hypothetical protein